MKAIAAVALLGWASLIGSAHAQSRQLMTFEEAKQRADSGDSFAQAVVALHYQLGWNTQKNPELAAKYALASANAGEPLGQFRLGALLRAGEGMPKDEQQGLASQAASFNSLNAAQDPYSMTAAGILVFQGKVVGQNVPQDQRRKDAAILYEKAAQIGYAPAQFNYAMALNDGHGVGVNIERRDEYLRQAASANYPLALEWQRDTSHKLEPVSAASGMPSDDTRDQSFGIKTVIQRSPAPLAFAVNSRLTRLASMEEGLNVGVWELPSGRFIRQFKLSDIVCPPTHEMFFCGDDLVIVGVKSTDEAEGNLWLADRFLRFVDPVSGVRQASDLEITLTASPTTPVRSVSFSGRHNLLAVSGSRELPDLANNGVAGPYSIEISTFILQNRVAKRVSSWSFKVPYDDYTAFFNERGELIIVRYEPGDGHLRLIECIAFSSTGELLQRFGASHADFRRKMGAITGLPPHLICSDPLSASVEDWLDPTQPEYRNAASLSALRSRFQWGAADISRIGNFNGPCEVAFVSSADGLTRLPLKGRDNVEYRYLCGTDEGFMAWGVSDFHCGQKPDLVDAPYALDLIDLSVERLKLPPRCTVLNAATRLGGGLKVVLGKEGGDAAAPLLRVSCAVWKNNNIVEHQKSGDYLVPFTFLERWIFDSRPAVIKSRFMLYDGRERSNQSTVLGKRDFLSQERGYILGVHEINSAYGRTEQPELYSDGYVCAESGISLTWRFKPISASAQGQLELKLGGGSTKNITTINPIVAARPVGQDIVIVTTRGIMSWDRRSQQPRDSMVFAPEDWLDRDREDFASGDLFSIPVQEFVAWNTVRREVYVAGKTGRIMVCKVSENGELREACRIEHASAGNPVLMTPGNFYLQPIPEPVSLHFSDGEKTFPFEQFDLRLNRPDIVLERLGAPAEAVGIAKQLREKRLRRMGVTEEMLKPDFHVPEIAIVGDVPTATDNDGINLAIKANDSKYPLERLKVFVNNVPVNGRNGELLRPESKSDAGLLGRITGAFTGASTGPQTLERTVPIKLAAGRNKIQVSVLNNAGAESLYANAEANCTAKRPKPTLYAVAMGVSEYSNRDWNLKYAAKDARDVLARLKDKAGDQYGEVKELLLTDKEVTKESISKIRNFLSGASIDDTVLMFVAGHGLLDSNYDYYFGTADIDFNNPSDKGIAFEEFDDLLADLPSLKKSLLIDTCHAGELDEDEKTLLASAGSASAALPTANGVSVRSIGTRGMNVKAVEGARGASEWYDRLQGLFVDLRRGSGSTILSSSAGAEYALESSEQQNGLFTYAVLEALDGKSDADTNKDGSVQMSELGEYVKKRVSELTNNKQTPNTRRVNLEGDFTLAKTR